MNAMITKNFKKKNKKNKGFTLVELIIVIAIIAILGVILAPQYIKYVDKSRWSTDQNNAKTLLKEVQTAVVDVQEQEKDPLAVATVAATITMNASGTTATGISNDLKDSLDGADNKWTETKVTNKGKASGKDSEGNAIPHTTYTITIGTDNKVSGKWD